MMCVKCGFISFDHLATCKKCHSDLNQTREVLGFAALEPSPPSLLASLLEDNASSVRKAAEQKPKPLEPAAEIDLEQMELPEILLDGLDSDHGGAGPIELQDVSDRAMMEPKWSNPSPMMSDLESDDLMLELQGIAEELSVKKSSAVPTENNVQPVSFPDLEIELEASPVESNAPAAPEPAQDASLLAELDEFDLDLDDQDLELLVPELEGKSATGKR